MPARPLWSGKPLDGQVLLLHAEQGYGDTLRFCRYATRIAGASRIVLQVPPALVGLLGTLGAGIEIVADGEPLPPFDLHCPMMSLAACCGTATPADIPAEVPYRHADPQATARWAQRLDTLPGLKVGLCWAGGHRPDADAQRADRRRSVSLSQFAPLARVPGVTLVSLQKGDPAAQEAAAPPPGLRLVDWTPELADFDDTAALVMALDLVVTVDIAVAHLAAALGRPVWMLNRSDSDWRWQRTGDDSPWYPTLRQFRQARPGLRADVVERLAQALAGRASA